MMYLRQSTSVDVPVGPFLDETDGITAEVSLTITQPDVRLKKNAGDWAQKAAAQTLTHEEAGWYELTLDTTDTNTIGQLIVAIHESGALPVWREFTVLDEAVYDALFGTTALAVAGGAMGLSDSAITTAKFAAGAIDAAAIANGAIAAATFAADVDAEILSYLVDDATQIDASALNTASGAVGSDGTGLTEAGGTGDQLTALATAANLTTVAGYLDTEIADILADTNELQTDWADGGRLDVILDAGASQTSLDALNDVSVADILAGTCDTGVSIAKVGEMLAALAAGKVSASSAAGVTTLTYKKRDGTTTSFTVVVTESDKTRATTGSLS